METISPEPAPTYLQLRDRILSLDPLELGLSDTGKDSQVWGVMMETGYETGTATLVAFADGTTSLYYSTGGGLLGSPDYAPVAEAGKAMVVQAEQDIEQMSRSGQIDLPPAGQVRFTLLTFSGFLTAQAAEKSLVSGEDKLSHLYQSGRVTINQLRLLKDKKRN